MAIDKNSKAYQSLITNGYTDEQITQMHDSVASGENAQNVVQNTQPANYDPMADLNPEYIANMDMNKQISGANQSFSQYWDDSSRDKQNTRGWLNEKYTWEWVKTSDINYNPDITTKDLNPNFVYGKQSQVYGTDHPGYISQRNDDIASALYNEWLTSREDVTRFLMSQNWFMNSTEEDRLNTIESVWKRLWAIAWQNKPDPSKAEQILTDTSGELYGKVTADEWTPSEWIDTLVDANSVFRSMQESRVANLKSLISMDSEKVGYLISEWLNPFWEQTMRDLMQYYPEKYQEIQNAVKKIKWQEDVNNIASWWTINVTSQLDASENNVTTSMNASINKTASGSWTWQLATNLNNALADSEIVSWAREQMEVYKRKIQEIQDAAEALPGLANQYFKWDVPEYMVNAFINNRMQQYNKEIQKYQNLYNASLQEAQMEISQQQWREEMNYKWTSLQADQNYRDANLELSKKELEYNRQKAAISNWQWNDDGSYSYVDLDWVMHTLSAEEAKSALNSDLYNYASEYINTWAKKIEIAKGKWHKVVWWQCEAFTDNFARQYFWTEMRWANGWVTTAKEKAAYATEALPQRWFIAVWDYWIVQKDWVNYWHTGIVIDYDRANWTFTTIESNVDGLCHVEIKTHSINDAKLQWFRDPSKWWTPKWSSWWSVANGEPYDVSDIEMLDVFSEIETSDKYNAEVKSNADFAKTLYLEMYDFKNSWELDVVTSDEFITKLSEFKNYLYKNLKNSEMFDSDWNILWTTLKQEMINQWMTPKEVQAYDSLHSMIQTKLRKESWAAINMSEWTWDYDMYMPQPWMTQQDMLRRIQKLENKWRNKLPASILKEGKYIQLITDEMIDAASTETLRENATDILKNNR